ncbi:hypothetical protein H8A99_29715, partial [Bradyrhizobium sp. Arg68]|nr:hypothetical protein [Bradyrhizobium ivorense]
MNIKTRILTLSAAVAAALASSVAVAQAIPPAPPPANAGNYACYWQNGTGGTVNGVTYTQTAAGDNSCYSALGATAAGHGTAAAGMFAVAQGDGSTAYGSYAYAMNASAAGAADGSTAFGYAAQATGPNSVAIGANSTTTIANTVSFGNATTQRVIVNVAPGLAMTDGATMANLRNAGLIDTSGPAGQMNLVAVTYNQNYTGSPTGGQYTGPRGVSLNDGSGGPARLSNLADPQTVLDAVNFQTLLPVRNTANSALALATTTSANALQYSSGLGAYTALFNNTTQRITNVGAGTLSASSTDAVNGTQLNTTNTQVSQNTTSITNLSGSVTNLSNTVSTLQLDGLQWSTGLSAYDASHGSGTAQKITNVGAGTLSASSTDAVNGTQLNTTNTQVSQNTTDITNLSGSVTNLNNTISTLQLDGLQWSAALSAFDAS